MKKLLLFLAFNLALVPASRAELKLPAVISDHMVLQQEQSNPIWGWDTPGTKITISFGGQNYSTTAGVDGKWSVKLKPLSANATPQTLTVSGSTKREIQDVLIGEVWLCSGQSNMEMGIGLIQDAEKEIAAANYPNIRLLMIPNLWKPEPQADQTGNWKPCTTNNIAHEGWGGFSAAGYFFGRELHRKLNVPVGLIDATWGGTRIESWTPPEGFASVPALNDLNAGDARSDIHHQKLERVLGETEKWLISAQAALTNKTMVPVMPVYPQELLPPHDVQNPSALYNGMIHPVHPFGIRGAIWYQGEANNGEGMAYADKMKALVSGWRQIWSEGEFPFYFVQIAPFNYGGDRGTLPELWEAQTLSSWDIPNVGMAVVNDIGNLKDIHPKNKQEVGRRLSLIALAKTYGQNEVVCWGPTFQSLTTEGSTLRVNFNHDDGGLVSRDGQPLNWFEIIDADEGGFVKADARIDGSSVVLSAAGVQHPVAMRFAWSQRALPNLMNEAGLPAGAFRAGRVPKRDWLSHVPEAKNYQLVYDLDLTKIGADIHWDVDNRNKITAPFDRIAYCVELVDATGVTKSVYVSMDAFTDSLDKIGVPTSSSRARFQQNVQHMNVFSDGDNIVTGTNLAGGNIEFWPNNYAEGNAAKVPNASDTAYDFGDQMDDGTADGYGSMQIHNHDARQTLFALNHWREGRRADLGIGNAPTGYQDWTFAANAGTYTTGRLRVFVHVKSTNAASAPVGATSDESHPMPKPIRIDAGATTAYTDSAGNVWQPEEGFADGDTVDRGSDVQIGNTKDPAIYRTEHWGMTLFTRKVPNGRYTVKLHFAETSENVSGPGDRVFSFSVGGHQFNDFDVWVKAGGPRRAYVETVNVEIANGKLDIVFTPKVEETEINGIEILSAD